MKKINKNYLQLFMKGMEKFILKMDVFIREILKMDIYMVKAHSNGQIKQN